MVVGSWLLACADPAAEVVNNEAAYFAINDVLDEQLTQLSGADLHKQVVMQADTEARALAQPDWPRELNLLREADINKPAWQGQYRIDTSTDHTVHYLAMSKKLPVQELIVVRMPDGRLQRVTARLHKSNYLYASARRIEMQFADEPVPRLMDYHVRGYQKIRLRDTIRFEVRGRVLSAAGDISRHQSEPDQAP